MPGGYRHHLDSEIDPHGGLLSFGGFIDMEAGISIDIGSPIDNTAEDGGSISIIAGDKVIIRDHLNVTGEGDAGSGGDIDIIAGTDVEISRPDPEPRHRIGHRFGWR